ncbi:hypothetical protein quinque_013039 [Culex quinquefasciatus]
MANNSGGKRPKITQLIAKVVSLDGFGGARCPWCPYHQELFLMYNFHRHIMAKHPAEAAAAGFADCRRYRKNAQQIPESLAKFVTSNDKGALCRITNGQCRYSQPVFNLKRFQRHMCLIHPWEALQQNLSIEQSGGSYPKNYQLVLQFLTYDANGIYCRMDPDSKCSYRLPTLNPYFFKRHFLDHHPEHAARYGITGDADDLPKAGSAVRTKTLSTLVEENVYMDERGSHCLLDPSCDFTVHGFDGLRLLNHFRRKHPALAKAKGFFEKKKSSQQAADVNGRIWQCTQKDDDGNFHCRIDGDCSFMQRKFSSIIFLHHFRYQHRSAAKKMSFCEKNRMLPKRNRWMKKNCRAPQYIQKVRQHTETDESGTRCRIAGLDCEYVQSTFRPGNFQRHFRNVHPKEAKQHGYFDDTSITIVKSEFGKPDAGNQPKRPDYGEMIEKHIMRDNLAIYCRISADYCRFRQFKFDLASFVRHFRKDHPKEARAKGFAKVGQTARKKIKKEAPDDPLAIKEEVEDGEEEQSDSADWGLLTPDEATPSMRPLTSIHELVEKNTLRVKTDVFCKISAEHCDYSRSEGFDSKDFVRHFRFKHPDEAREKGFFGEENEEQLPLERKSFRCLVMENVLVDEKGIHCMISETACPLFQIAFNVGNFVRHFRNEHAQLAEEKGFVRRKFLKKYRKQKRTAAEETSERVPYVAPISRRELVEKYVEKTETGIQCKLTDYCKHVQVKEFRYNNFYRHFISTHPVEAKAAGFFDDGRYLNYVATAKPGKLLYTQLVKKWTERDDIGTHCRIASSKCRYVQRYNYCSGNFVRHFRIEHPKEARKYGFFRDQDSDNEAPETESEAESVANEVKMESFSLEGNEPESICPDAPQEHPLQRKNITFKELVMDYISSEGDGVHCRIAQRPCRYVQKGTFSYHNVVSHFRTAHPTEARAAGFFRNLAAASEPDLDSVERIIPDEPDARDETMESFTREESQLEIPCPDTFRDKPPEESHSEDQSVSQSQLTEKYILRDEVGVHCRISQWPCKYVQTGIYAYRNFVRHFRSIHPKEARKVGFFAGVNETPEPETEHESVELGEGQSMDPDTSDDERWKLKNGLPSLKRLTKKFIYQDAQGVYCRISAQPCRYIQRGEYKYTNFVRHFRTEHTAEATEAGFFRDHSEATEQESVNGTVEQEDSDTDIPLELDLGGKTGLIEIVAKCVYRNQKGIHCRISSSPCSYVQTSGFKYRNFISHFAIQHTEEASKAGFFRNDNDSSEPELEPVGGIACDSITQDETMESFTTEQSQPENAEASQARALLWKKPSLKELAEKCIFRDENGAHCRIASWPCKYVQSSTFVVGNFVRHFRTEHPKEARKIGFFREKSKPDPVPAQNSRIEDVTLEPMVVEQSRPVEVLRPVMSQDKSKRRKNALTFTELAEKCIVRDEEGVHCRITPWPPCKYVQKSTFVVGNLVRHFRTEHPMEARKIGFFKESSESELDLTHDRASESFILEESQPEIPCPDTPCDDPALYCKLCFSVDLPLVPICSGPDAADNPLVESIEECINVRITADDDGWICSECSQKLVDFQQFRQLSRIHYSAVRRKKQQLATTTFSNPIVVHSANEADSFYVEIVKQENDIETHTEPSVTEQPGAEPCDDQKPFIELPNGSFSCRMCPQTFPSLGPTMEHFISAHSEAMTHTNSVLAVDYSDKPPFKPVTINNVQYLKCADCDTLTEHGEAIIEHRKRFHAGVKMLPTIRCDRVECEQFFMDNPAYRRHLEICHDVIDPGEEGS